MPQIAFPLENITSWQEVCIREPDTVHKKIECMRRSSMSIISDFDRTLTKHFIDGAERPSLIGSLRATGVLSPEYTFAAYCLYDFFYPIEIDVSLSHEERAEAMEQWWNAHLSLLTGMMSYETLRSIVGDDTIMKRLYDTKYNLSDAEKQFWEKHRESREKIPVQLTQKIIEDAIHSGIVELRNGTDRFFQETLSFHIPIIIFSANGLGTDPITSYLTSHHLMFSNIHIVSNAFTWSPDGRANGYRQPVIHSFNKSIAGIKKFPDIYAYVKDAGSIVLLGDSLGDARMAEGHDADTILRIGLLTKQGEHLEQEKRAYSEAFDIVLVGDGDLTFLPALLHTIQGLNSIPMATSLSTLEYFLDCLSLVPDLSYRKMFGEYGIYSGEKMFALACDNMLFFKTFPETLHHFADTETRAYPGSKNTAMVNPEWLEDRILIAEIAGETIARIPSPKRKQ